MRVVFMGTPAFAVPSLEALDTSDHEVAVRGHRASQARLIPLLVSCRAL